MTPVTVIWCSEGYELRRRDLFRALRLRIGRSAGLHATPQRARTSILPACSRASYDGLSRSRSQLPRAPQRTIGPSRGQFRGRIICERNKRGSCWGTNDTVFNTCQHVKAKVKGRSVRRSAIRSSNAGERVIKPFATGCHRAC